ncbi:Septation ring formation regulator EzrA [Jeotgalicoccus aerolatus]|uniref:Septation ring formation regulator n=1 Tax=Jeotgalicoccus aerolatus TaxID=709510 RepID=A0A1G9EH53_9STAP|nr:septation ring formation regulator EzrA [Jeotgalicoccus aerolatus]MBP1952537.1 septation ring formation regulator [Jeotgalicoccus aerolatus]NMA80349.1 septation ring formation regulator EzrA [Jeotgalicoccus aerolatus]CAD2074578.1 Septation ring formation regulator EzrA [Jeotgalicoccus aerolatus]SDK75507.1 septation ring formation regulator [Jeotgalicoccus aerolatus]GGD92933.1 septation ring formation regulator EzrA [Jeotgalicoccus aerolatus]
MWVYILIAIIILVIVTAAVLLYLRSVKTQMIETQYSRLHEVNQLPFKLDLVKLKNYNLHGEAKTLYNNWQDEWNQTLNTHSTHATNALEQSKVNVEKFRFAKSTNDNELAGENINIIKNKYDELTEEVAKFMESVEQGKTENIESERLYREAKRDVLANGHKFGDAKKPLEEVIKAYEPEMAKYEKMVNDGDYLRANEFIFNTHNELLNLKDNMEEIPLLIKEVQKELPQQFQELRYGCRDLRAKGYDLDHIKVENRLSTLKSNLNRVEPLVAKLELEEADSILENIHDELDDMYALVEHEVTAKNKFDGEKDVITDELFNAKALNYTLRTEIDYIQEQYHIDESDVQKVMNYENEIENLITIYSDMIDETEKNTTRYSAIVDNIDYLKNNAHTIHEEQNSIQEHLVNLREDDAEARENINYVNDRKEKVYRELMSSNLVTLPEQFIVMKHEIEMNIREIDNYFSRRPLNVEYVKAKVNDTVLMMNKFEQEAYAVMRDSQLTELMIQYGNRFRSTDPDLNNQLNEAERLFKENRYKRALDVAKDAVESAEPGSAGKIEKQFDTN